MKEVLAIIAMFVSLTAGTIYPVKIPQVIQTETAAEVSVSASNALKAAKQYLKVMPFSYKKLIKQLEFDGYSSEDATYAADSCEADWDEQAVKAAKNYLKIMAFSEKKLIQQLEFDGFTNEQATYAAEQNGF